MNATVIASLPEPGRVLKFRHAKSRDAHQRPHSSECHVTEVIMASDAGRPVPSLSTEEGARRSSAHRTLIVGAGRFVADLRSVILERCADQYDIVATMEVRQARRQQAGQHERRPLEQIILDQDIQCVVVALKEWADESVFADLLACRASGIPIWDGLELYERMTGKVYLDELQPRALLVTPGSGAAAKVGTRALDLALAFLCLTVTWPLFLALPLLIALTSRGPVLFRQTRSGLHGRAFTMLKFRSMACNAEASGLAVWAAVNDPRITRVGAFMRRFRMDELPQLFNILQGDMSFIGPRPERPEFVKMLEHLAPCYALRHAVKPGLTGWAQVCFRYGASVQDAMEKLAYDLYYLKRRSLVLDWRIVLKTVRTVLAGAGVR